MMVGICVKNIDEQPCGLPSVNKFRYVTGRHQSVPVEFNLDSSAAAH